MKKMVLLYTVFICMQAAAQRTIVYLGSYNWNAKTEGIALYELDTAQGRLTKLGGFTGMRNPSFITLSPSGKYLYACTDSKTPNAGGVSSYALERSSLRFLNTQSSHGENPVYVSVHNSGKWLVNANYTAGTLALYPLLADGRIDSAVQTIQFTGNSINKERQEHSHAHSAVFSPDGRYVFVADLGTDKIYCYPFNKRLQEEKMVTVNTVPGSGPRHLTFHPNGKFLYCIEELAGYVSVYRCHKGRLNSVQRIATTGFESADIHCSPDGKFLYASNRGKNNNISIFSIQPNGLLTFTKCEPTGGEHPRAFAIDPLGKFVVVANVVTNTVTVLKRNANTGLLTNTGHQVQMPAVSSVQIRSIW